MPQSKFANISPTCILRSKIINIHYDSLFKTSYMLWRQYNCWGHILSCFFWAISSTVENYCLKCFCLKIHLLSGRGGREYICVWCNEYLNLLSIFYFVPTYVTSMNIWYPPLWEFAKWWVFPGLPNFSKPNKDCLLWLVSWWRLFQVSQGCTAISPQYIIVYILFK